MSSSLSVPTAEPSMLRKTRASVSLRFSSWRARSRTFAKSSLREDVEALLLDRLLAAELGLGVAQGARSRSPALPALRSCSLR